MDAGTFYKNKKKSPEPKSSPDPAWQSMIIMLRFISVSQSFKSEVKLCGKCETLLANETAESGSKKSFFIVMTQRISI